MHALEPFTIQNVTFRNKIGMAPMCTYLVHTGDGVANEFHLAHYVTHAMGQLGFIIQEATAVNEHGYISEQCLGIYNERQVSKLKEIVSLVHKTGCKMGIQLNHSGMKNRYGNQKVGPMDAEDVVGLSQEQIKKIVLDFERAAYNAHKAGYDFVEIHGAHGYLINQFLSPLTNQRADEYGQDRTLFLKEVIQAVISGFGDNVWLRLSMEEYEAAGLHLEQMVEIAKLAQSLGVKAIDASSGGLQKEAIHAYPLYQVPYATAAKAALHIPVLCVGLIQEVEQIEHILEQEQADLVLLGRKLLRDPFFVAQMVHTHKLEDHYTLPTYLKRGLL
ncbi:MAG: tRNA-dihydrouridine synthase [Erysipelotrichaceae bacterium]